MKPYELSRNSWHFRIAVLYGGFRHLDHWGDERADIDFCAYLRSVAWAMAKLTVTLAILAIIAYCFYDLAAWVVTSIQTGKWLKPEGAAAVALFMLLCVAVVGAIVLIVLGLAWVLSKMEDLADRHISNEPGFIALAIDKVRNKACVQIKFKD